MSDERRGPVDPGGIERLLRHLEGRLAPDEAAALVAELRADGGARRRAARLLLQLGYLDELGREARAEPHRWPQPRVDARRRPRRMRWVAGALALAGAAAAALLVARDDSTKRAPASGAGELRSPEPIAGGHGNPPRVPITKERMLPLPAFATAPTPSAAVALLVRGADSRRGAEVDGLMARRLEGLGLTVVEVTEDRLQAEDLVGRAVIVISSSTTGDLWQERIARLGLRELPVPVVTCENTTFGLLGMTGPNTSRQRGAAPRKMTVEIEPTAHPMAAGLPAGQARLASAPVSLSWGEPGDGATKIATLEGSKHRRAVLFGYDRGASMVTPGLLAPARRVGCFLVQDNVGAITETGWQLFDAAVTWAAAP